MLKQMAGEMSQRLKALSAFPQDPGPVHGTCDSLQPSPTPVSRHLKPSSSLCRH